jgi:hypothetical protein
MVASRAFGEKNARIPGLVTRGKGGLPGEIADLRHDVEEGFAYYEQTLGGVLVTEEFTNLLAADTDGLKTAAASSASIQSFTSADWNGVQGDDEMVPPRNVTLTTSTHADINAVAVVVTGRVRNDRGELIAQTETINLTDGGGVTNAGTEAFSFVDSVVIPAQGGTGGTVAIGFGVLVGLARKIRSAAGLPLVLQQVTAGAVVTNGTFATTAPNGTWSPNTAANGTNDYALVYVADMRT